MRTEEEIRARIAEFQADERCKMPTSNIFINAPLALIQLSIEVATDTLRWVLKEHKPGGGNGDHGT